MRFANTEAGALLASETIAFSGGSASVELRQAMDGQGWVRCRPAPLSGGGWALGLAFHTSDLDTATTTVHEMTVPLT